jgi:tRNA-dihydrouridine synthase A
LNQNTKIHYHNSHRFSVAPMMDWTDTHCRVVHRLLTRHSLLYTEMLTPNAIIFGDRQRLLGYDQSENPVALQLGGSEPEALVKAAKIGQEWGYDEINLNIGCPSDRVQSGRFGACLMREPELVGDCVKALKDAVSLPITVKCRIGVDDQDPQTALFALAAQVVSAGTDALIVHARKAWLKGLSPKDNRDIPPLDYPLVYKLKAAFPDVPIIINGGVTTLDQTQEHLNHVDGVMMGRAAYHSPEILMQVDEAVFGKANPFSNTHTALEALIPYLDAHVTKGGRVHAITRHLHGFFQGRSGSRAFRRFLSTECVKLEATPATFEQALKLIQPADFPAESLENVG